MNTDSFAFEDATSSTQRRRLADILREDERTAKALLAASKLAPRLMASAIEQIEADHADDPAGAADAAARLMVRAGVLVPFPGQDLAKASEVRCDLNGLTITVSDRKHIGRIAVGAFSQLPTNQRSVRVLDLKVGPPPSDAVREYLDEALARRLANSTNAQNRRGQAQAQVGQTPGQAALEAAAEDDAL